MHVRCTERSQPDWGCWISSPGKPAPLWLQAPVTESEISLRQGERSGKLAKQWAATKGTSSCHQ